MHRRQAIKMLAMGIAASISPPVFSGNNVHDPNVHDPDEFNPAVYLIPGYHPSYSMQGGHTLDSHPDFVQGIPVGYEGPRTMVTRIKEGDPSIKRAVFPISGHHLAISQNQQQALFSSLDGESMVLFSTDDLQLIKLASPHKTGFVGGGHAVFLPDNKHVVVTERRRYVTYSGKAEQHYGCITIRDAETLKVVEVYSCGGIGPHDIALMADGRHVVVSNYGSTDWPSKKGKAIPYVVEPSLTVINLESGKVVHKIISTNLNNEIRHVAAHDMGRVFAIQTRMVESAESYAFLSQGEEVMGIDLSTAADVFYAPAPLLGLQFTKANTHVDDILPDNALLFRQGQTIIYDPVYDEAIVTYTSANVIAIIDGKSRHIKKIIRTDSLGLHHPRGVQLHPDGIHYAVSGSWRDIYLFRRGNHELNRSRCLYETFYDHSHLSIV